MSASYNLGEDFKTVTTISWDLSNGESFSLDMSKVSESCCLSLRDLFRLCLLQMLECVCNLYIYLNIKVVSLCAH